MVIVGIDPGKSGAISILEEGKEPQIYGMPLKKIKINNKNKNVYDLIAICNLLRPFENKPDIYFVIERQGVRPGEGAVSAMTIGEGFGSLKGIATAFGFSVEVVSAPTWKKAFPELITAEMEGIKVRAKIAVKKEKIKLNKKFKELSKNEARNLAKKLYSNLSDLFSRKKDDGKAESLLIALYWKKQHELVQDSQK